MTENPKTDDLYATIVKHIPAQYQNNKMDIVEYLDVSLKTRFQKSPSEHEWYIQYILSSPTILNELITDLILIFKIEHHQFPKERPQINLMADFREPIKQHILRYEHKKLKTNIFIQPNIEIHAPKLEFTRSVIHMVDNACKFSPEGKSIIIYLAVFGIGGCIFTVIDDGEGIPAANQSIAFERNMYIPQGKNQNISLQLGLPIVRGVATHLGGNAFILKSMKGCGVQMSIPPES